MFAIVGFLDHATKYQDAIILSVGLKYVPKLNCFNKLGRVFNAIQLF